MDPSRKKDKYFTEFTYGKAVLYLLSFVFCLWAVIAAVIEPSVSLPCDSVQSPYSFANPVYNGSPCRLKRHVRLLFLNREECSYTRRLLSAVILGGFIGWERRHADRPAGIRTMSLVSLGSSLFTITSTFAFISGPNEWDASRISAAIPSGVGFLGAGLIFKQSTGSTSDGGSTHVVHGLTTAASVWLSAAVGIACGGELYFAAALGTAIILLLLRFGPRNSDLDQDDDDEDGDELHQDFASNRSSYLSTKSPGANSTVPLSERKKHDDCTSETGSLLGKKLSTRRARAALASEV